MWLSGIYWSWTGIKIELITLMKRIFSLFSIMLVCSVTHADVVTDDSHTIGESLSRSFINQSNIESLPEIIKAYAYAVASFGRGSAFYIGDYDGSHRMMTAAHTALEGIQRVPLSERTASIQDQDNLCRVFVNDKDSDRKEFYLGLSRIYVTCKKLVYLDEAADIAIFEVETFGQTMPTPIEVSALDNTLSYGAQLGFYSYSRFQNFGVNGNLDLVFSTDSDCRNFSENEIDTISSEGLISNDELIHNVYTVGCDFIGGDSGGPVFDLSTGKLIGLVLGGRRQGARAIGESGQGLYESFLALEEKKRVQIKERYLNHVSVIDAEVIEFLSSVKIK